MQKTMGIPDKPQPAHESETNAQKESVPVVAPQGTLASPQNTLVVPEVGPNQEGNTDNSTGQLEETKFVKEEKPAYIEDLELEHDVAWMNQFRWLLIVLIIFGRWPITYSREKFKRGYVFKFSWKCPGFFTFVVAVLFTVYGFVVSSVNVVAILMSDKFRDVNSKTETEIIEQGLAERHTIILIILLGSYGINAFTLCFIFVKRHQISEAFTKWTRFLHFAKLSGAAPKTYVNIAAGNYLVFLVIYIVLTIFRTSATFIGGPTVVGMLFTRHFFSSDYLIQFVESWRHKLMHILGMVIYIYLMTACNIYMYLFLWMLKSIESAMGCWNTRMTAVVEANTSAVAAASGEDKPQPQFQPNHPRLTYNTLYHDHIGLVRMLSWFNNMFAYTFEPYILFMVIRVVYQLYLAALVMKSNGRPLNAASVGKYFIRKSDYIPPLLMTYENCFMLLTMFLASSWLEDTAYDSYDILRKHCLLNGTSSDRQSFFFLSMFQSYTSTTKMAVYAGHYFCINRYTILHVLSAIMSNFLVVYQFSPLFDMDTVQYPLLRNITGKFLAKFEGLPETHILPVTDRERNQASF